MAQAQVITISRTQRGGAYSDVLDFLETLKTKHGSVANAAAQVIRDSDGFREWSDQHSASAPSRKRRRAS